MPPYDVIVLGLGGMGSAAAFHLARRGRRVLGLDQFAPAHARGSSHGHSRIIRTAYYEHPGYVPLVRRAFDLWYELELFTGRPLLLPAECLGLGPPTGEVVTGVCQSAAAHGLPIETLSAAEVAKRFPAFRPPDEFVGVVERLAGILLVEACVQAHLDAAGQFGAELHHGEPVREWRSTGTGVEVRTDNATYTAAKLVVTAGAWATRLLADLGVPFAVLRQVMHWFAPPDPALVRRDRFPVYLVESPTGAYYGMPMIDPRGHKAARHFGVPELPSPDAVDWTVRPEDVEIGQAFVNTYLPAAAGPCTHSQICMYTTTPDKHFVIDIHPHHPNVAVAAGFSGHGFKFAPAVGEVLADLADAGRTSHPIELFRSTRFA
ncbi:MAG TPA: N-methyl-L-tryptophan oxidase [Fimbriiglobus sp.]|jgi:sarcosine oxidase